MTKCATEKCCAIVKAGTHCQRCAKARKPAGTNAHIKVEVRTTWDAPGGDA